MQTTNTRWVDANAIVSYLSPYYHNTGSQTMPKVEIKKAHDYTFITQQGPVIAAVDAYLQGSPDDSTWTTLSGKSITQQTTAHGCQIVQVRDSEIPTSYLYLRGVVHVSTAASYVGALIIASNPRYAPAYEFDSAIVDEIVPTP